MATDEIALKGSGTCRLWLVLQQAGGQVAPFQIRRVHKTLTSFVIGRSSVCCLATTASFLSAILFPRLHHYRIKADTFM